MNKHLMMVLMGLAAILAFPPTRANAQEGKKKSAAKVAPAPTDHAAVPAGETPAPTEAPTTDSGDGGSAPQQVQTPKVPTTPHSPADSAPVEVTQVAAQEPAVAASGEDPPGTASAAPVPPPPEISSGDTAWVLASAALVLLMTPGLAFFYGGLVRRKNILSILMQCMAMMCIITVEWVIVGYSMSFSPTKGGWLGGFDWMGLAGVGLEPNADYAATIPHQAFMIFQAMFAIITPGLILGAFAERMKFSSFCVFSLLWALLVYNPVCHWVWGVGGVLRVMGALDFAGGTVVHINAGMAALAAAIVLGKRKGFPQSAAPPHNLPFAILGAGILWFGWFGFNAGSALGAGGLATSAFVVTHVAAATAGLTWMILDWFFHTKPTALGMITGAVAGLVAITPAAGFVTVTGALGIGIGVSLICYFFVTKVKPRFGYDDTLDAFGVHGVGGIWGALATGLWATKTVNSAGADGLFYGNPGQLAIQLKATLATMVFSFVLSFILLKIVDAVMGLRVSEEDEMIGLDQTQHNETGYSSEP